MALIERQLRPQLEMALDAFRAVVLHGARQCGKTTLAKVVVGDRGGTYVSLDDDAMRAAAIADPITFLQDQGHPLAVDEVQLAGDRLVRAVKRLVDDDPTPGRFLLTGSTNFLTVPTISESLAGRARLLQLHPLSEAELAGIVPSTIAAWFDGEPGTPGEPIERAAYLERLCRGGYPECITLDAALRAGWFDSYLQTVTERDLVALADIRKVTALRRLLRWTAGSTSNELNVATAARELGIDRSTVVSYLEWLQAVFLVTELPAWSRKITSRAARKPKLHLTDTGLAAALLGLDPDALAPPTATMTGPMLETFVLGEVRKQIGASGSGISAHHLREAGGHEVDLVLERRDGAIVALEVKATRSPTAAQLRNLAWLRDRLDTVAPGTFRCGVLLHTGDQAVTIGDRLHLRPISTLWAEDPGSSA